MAVDIIRERIGDISPKLGIVVGSGLGGIAESLANAVRIPFADLPGFPQPNVHGIGSELVVGQLGETWVAILTGRSHYYEVAHHEEVKTYVRTLKAIGCEIYLATNASGSLRADVGPGRLVLIEDHINFQGTTPLIGPNDDDFGTRFPAIEYAPDIRQQLMASAKTADIDLAAGVYICVCGPNYETAAEIRMFKQWGADCVGMSTVPEVIVANHCGLKVAVVSMVTNLATGLDDNEHDHANVVATAEKASADLIKLISTYASQLA